ncbi:VirB8 family type IV secretion system protein [Helicobacter trogontum]|uniref:Type IV secretion system protein n=1 Tax=Helicobacter trogontum TaxID=50960 RepID=A0A4U8S3S1_9HELI|nr:type IV secretion system protein [Helicobacter trogontum]TLD80361.1 type IV secretion system protein [Helicobacter trogontum]
MNKETHYNEALSYEASMRYMIEQSNKRAWLIAFIGIALSFLSVIALVLLVPLKTVQPYVIRVDNTTGMVDIITALKKEDITGNEALDKYFISEYVKKREGYYYDMLNSDYVTTQLLSSDKVAQEYRAIYEGENARDKIFKNTIEVKANILSITLGESAGVKTSTIRIQTTTTNQTSKLKTESVKIVTLSYDYYPNDAKESVRLANPLGFKVLTYRVDNEVQK